jgi:hypothetical protein
MAHYPDLSKYEYSRDRPLWPRVLLNVGWLGTNQPFPTGDCPRGFIAHLRELAKSPAALTRGFHQCEFCPRSNDPQQTPRGNGEIRVRGTVRTIYAAPTLIVHYVDAHHYQPPEEFIAAVLRRGKRGRGKRDTLNSPEPKK